jgi:hypothetical protein
MLFAGWFLRNKNDVAPAGRVDAARLRGDFGGCGEFCGQGRMSGRNGSAPEFQALRADNQHGMSEFLQQGGKGLGAGIPEHGFGRVQFKHGLGTALQGLAANIGPAVEFDTGDGQHPGDEQSCPGGQEAAPEEFASDHAHNS